MSENVESLQKFSTNRLTPTRILIAEDQTLVNTSLALLLHNHDNFSVVAQTFNGTQTIHCAGKILPDVILMDIRMPFVDGIEATRVIKNHHPDIHVVILTSYDTYYYKLHAYKSGATLYLLKDIAPERLAKIIREISQQPARRVNSNAQDSLSSSSPTGAHDMPRNRAADILQAISPDQDPDFIPPDFFPQFGRKDVSGEISLNTGKTNAQTEANADTDTTMNAALVSEHDERGKFTDRELEIIGLLTEGCSNDMISQFLQISIETVKTHISHILHKTHSSNRSQIINYAYEYGLLGKYNAYTPLDYWVNNGKLYME